MTLFDHAVLALIGFSVLTGLLRGFTREVISLASWAVAFLLASIYGGDAAPLLARQIPDESWRALAAVVAANLRVAAPLVEAAATRQQRRWQ